jgi:hypothetical protein
MGTALMANPPVGSPPVPVSSNPSTHPGQTPPTQTPGEVLRRIAGFLPSESTESEHPQLRFDLKAEVALSVRGEELGYDGAIMAGSAVAHLGERTDFRIDGASEREFTEAAIERAHQILAGRPEQLERFKAELSARFAHVFDADHALKLLCEESWRRGRFALDEAAGRAFADDALARAAAFFARRPEQMEWFREELAEYVAMTYGD